MENAEPARKRRKGGIKQRERAAERERQEESALHFLLMNLFAQEIFSWALVHSIAKAAKEDLDKAAQGKTLPKLEQLAALKHDRNLQNSIFNQLNQESSLPLPVEAFIPLKDAPEERTASLLLPHEMFSAMFDNVQGWAQSILPDEQMLPKFWACFQSHPCMEGHPLLKRKDFQNCCIPLGLHGDEVPVTGIGKIWSRSALVLSWTSLLALAAGRTLEDTNLYIFGLFEQFVKDDSDDAAGTVNVLWAILAWSFRSIWEGKWPAGDWRGVRFLAFIYVLVFQCLFCFGVFFHSYSPYFFLISTSTHQTPKREGGQGLTLLLVFLAAWRNFLEIWITMQNGWDFPGGPLMQNLAASAKQPTMDL